MHPGVSTRASNHGNILLVLGLSVLAGGIKYSRQTFIRTVAALGSTLLALSVIGLLVPAFYHHVVREELSKRVLLLAVYLILGIAFYLLPSS